MHGRCVVASDNLIRSPRETVVFCTGERGVRGRSKFRRQDWVPNVASASQNYLAVIKVVGVGGGGVNAVNRMIEAGLRGVEHLRIACAGKGVGEEEDTECEQFGEKEDPHGDIAL